MFLPRTFPDTNSNSVITVNGTCVQNASPSLNNNNSQNDNNLTLSLTPPSTFVCRADGTWQLVSLSKCECEKGYIPSLKSSLCTG